MNIKCDKSSKLTFKKQPRNTGLYAVGHPWSNTDIKVKKHIIGNIEAPNYTTKDNLWIIRFCIADSTGKCGFKWITLNKKGESEEESRNIAKEIFPVIIETYSEFYCLE